MADVEKVDPFKEQALNMLRSLIDAATQAGEFIKGQIPLVIQELLTFNTAFYIFTLVASIAAAGGLVWAFRYFLRKNATDQYDSFVPGMILSGIGIGFSVFVAVVFAIKLLKITLAPRVWLIEYAAGLVR